MATPKTIHIPYLPELDNIDAEIVADILEEKGQRQTIDSLNWAKDYPYHPLTVFSTAHSDEYLYIDFFVRANYLRAVNYLNNSPVYEDSCIEVFLQPENAMGTYYNFEFNCIGTINASRRISRDNSAHLTDAELDSVKRHASCGNRPFQEVEGLFTWNVVIAIPLQLIGLNYTGSPITLRGNFYKCASATSQPHFLSWSPIDTPQPDFHRPEFFGTIILD